MTANVISICPTCQFQLQQRIEPVLRRPFLQRVRPAAEPPGNREIDPLALVGPRHGECVRQRAQGEQEGRDVEGQPQAVPAPAEVAPDGLAVVPRAAPEPDREGAAAPDDDKCRPARAVGRVALVHEDLGWRARDGHGRAVVDDVEGVAGTLGQEGNGCRDEGQLDDGDDHQEANKDLQQEGCRCHGAGFSARTQVLSVQLQAGCWQDPGCTQVPKAPQLVVYGE